MEPACCCGRMIGELDHQLSQGLPTVHQMPQGLSAMTLDVIPAVQHLVTFRPDINEVIIIVASKQFAPNLKPFPPCFSLKASQ